MNAPIEISKLMNRKGHSDSVSSIFYVLMCKCNQSYSEIKKMPIPLVINIMKKLEAENKEIEKQNRRMKHG
jgi:hypothetical protein